MKLAKIIIVLFFTQYSLIHSHNIVVVGAGYVGLVSGTCFTLNQDNHTTIIECEQKKIALLLQDKIPFYEPGLDELIKNAIEKKHIEFTPSIQSAFKKHPQIIFLCVGTPSALDGSADLSYVYNAAKEIGQQLTDYCVIVDKSTVPVGTAKKVKQIIQEQLDKRGVSVKFDVASNPEFLQEGSAIVNFTQPDRVVIGTDSDNAKKLLIDLYTPFVKTPSDIICMGIESAELTKYASNAMLATRISFMNEIALLADKVGADVEDIKRGMAKDKRIGPGFLNAGIGYGGSCFPKDVKALVHTGKEYNQNMSIVEQVELVNQAQRKLFIQKIIDYYGKDLKTKCIGIWGLSFKPETDDIRYAPSVDAITALLQAGAKIIVYDPQAQKNIQAIFGGLITYAQTMQNILSSCDCLVLLTEWKEFINHKPNDFLSLKDKVVFDGRNCFDPVLMAQAGVTYFTIGRNIYKL